jgi:hypothetical protein
MLRIIQAVRICAGRLSVWPPTCHKTEAGGKLIGKAITSSENFAAPETRAAYAIGDDGANPRKEYET